MWADKKDLVQIGMSKDDKCECGGLQDDEHIYESPNFEGTCSKEDMDVIIDNTIQLASYWMSKILIQMTGH